MTGRSVDVLQGFRYIPEMAFKKKLPEDIHSVRFEFSLTPRVAEELRNEAKSNNLSSALWLRRLMEQMFLPVHTGAHRNIPETLTVPVHTGRVPEPLASSLPVHTGNLDLPKKEDIPKCTSVGCEDSEVEFQLRAKKWQCTLCGRWLETKEKKVV